jgi:predicted molibdopterin-dependent oxidoreductase YjgC
VCALLTGVPKKPLKGDGAKKNRVKRNGACDLGWLPMNLEGMGDAARFFWMRD